MVLRANWPYKKWRDSGANPEIAPYKPGNRATQALLFGSTGRNTPDTTIDNPLTRKYFAGPDTPDIAQPFICLEEQ